MQLYNTHQLNFILRQKVSLVFIVFALCLIGYSLQRTRSSMIRSCRTMMRRTTITSHVHGADEDARSCPATPS